MSEKNCGLVSCLISAMILSSPAIGSEGRAPKLSWSSPESRINGDDLDPQTELEGFLLYENMNNNGWSLHKFIPISSSYGNGYDFKVPLENGNVEDQGRYKVLSVDTDGLKSPFSDVVSVNYSEFLEGGLSIGEGSQTIGGGSSSSKEVFEGDNYEIDVTKRPERVYGDISLSSLEDTLLLDNTNFEGELGYFAGFGVEYKIGSQAFDYLHYDVDSENSSTVVLSIKSGNNVYHNLVNLDKGKNNGYIPLNDFVKKVPNSQTNSVMELPFKDDVESLDKVIEQIGISGGNDKLNLNNLEFKNSK